MCIATKIVHILFITLHFCVLFSGQTLNVFLHQDALYGLSVDPLNDNVFASACDDGRVLIFDIRQPATDG